jgi:hypothetical protein
MERKQFFFVELIKPPLMTVRVFAVERKIFDLVGAFSGFVSRKQSSKSENNSAALIRMRIFSGFLQ